MGRRLFRITKYEWDANKGKRTPPRGGRARSVFCGFFFQFFFSGIPGLVRKYAAEDRSGHASEVGQSGRVSARGCLVSSNTIVSIGVLNCQKKKAVKGTNDEVCDTGLQGVCILFTKKSTIRPETANTPLPKKIRNVATDDRGLTTMNPVQAEPKKEELNTGQYKFYQYFRSNQVQEEDYLWSFYRGYNSNSEALATSACCGNCESDQVERLASTFIETPRIHRLQ